MQDAIYVVRIGSDGSITVSQTLTPEGNQGYDVSIVTLRGFDDPGSTVSVYSGTNAAAASHAIGLT